MEQGPTFRRIEGEQALRQGEGATANHANPMTTTPGMIPEINRDSCICFSCVRLCSVNDPSPQEDACFFSSTSAKQEHSR